MDEWIFSDEAHRWMDSKRSEAMVNENCTYQSVQGRAGWEYGLFGIKKDDLIDALSCSKRHGPAYWIPVMLEAEKSEPGFYFCPQCRKDDQNGSYITIKTACLTTGSI